MRNAPFIIIIAMAVSVLAGCLLAEDTVAGANPATAPQPGGATDARAERFVLSGHVVAAASAFATMHFRSATRTGSLPLIRTRLAPD